MTDLNKVAKTYKSIKNEILALEFALEPYKMILETAALDAPGMKLDLEDFKISLIEAHRENFNLRQAKVALGIEIVSPFIKIISYSQLRVLQKPELKCLLVGS